jgi:tRNA dimethylallyltransferase
VICGPTAAGKSTLALKLAAEFGGAVISADSRQVYRGFDVGTAKPTLEERAAVPHYGIDLADPTERFSAARWADHAEWAVQDSLRRGLAPLVVGGTGFYLRALFDPLFEEPVIDVRSREILAAFLDSLPAAELRRWCRTLDTALADMGRAQLLRAVEVALLTGRRLSDLRRERARAPRLEARYLVIDPGQLLGGMIEQRVHQMSCRRMRRRGSPPVMQPCGQC